MDTMESMRVGGTAGGGKLFFLGLGLSVVSAWFFVDSVRVNSYGNGWISGGFGGFGGTGSMGVLFLPLMVGIMILFYDAKKLAGWVVTAVGMAVLGIEILSRMRFFFDLKLSHLLIMLISFSAGIGLMFRSFKSDPPEDNFALQQQGQQGQQNQMPQSQ